VAASLPRVLLAFGLLGAGLVNLGLVRGTFPTPAGVLALLLGTAEVVGAVLVLARSRPDPAHGAAAPRVAIGGLVAASAAQVALAVAPGNPLGTAVAAAATLQLAAAGAVGVVDRQRADGLPATPGSASPPAPRADPPRRRPAAALAVLFAGAFAVSTVTTVGLSATAAGEHAVPHGEHDLPNLPGRHGHRP
jgi:hypothetical protein